MPFGSRRNNTWFLVAVIFVSISCITTVIGRVLWNTKSIEVTIEQNVLLLEQHREMFEVLKRMERHYLDESAKP